MEIKEAVCYLRLADWFLHSLTRSLVRAYQQAEGFTCTQACGCASKATPNSFRSGAGRDKLRDMTCVVGYCMDMTSHSSHTYGQEEGLGQPGFAWFAGVGTANMSYQAV